VNLVRQWVFSVVILVGLWIGFALCINNNRLVPTPWILLRECLPTFSDWNAPTETAFGGIKTLVRHLGITAVRIAIGTTIGTFLGFLIGILISTSGVFRLWADHSLSVMRAVPLLALIPLFVFWFGGAEIGILLWIAYASMVIIGTATAEAVWVSHPNYRTLARLFGAKRHQVLFTIIVPSIVPDLVNSYRATLGYSWAFSLGGEYLVARSGLGYLVSNSYMHANMQKLFLLAIVYAVAGMITFWASSSLRFLCRWSTLNTQQEKSK
jgi:ABC-type nitrate/sulfonate/bicarbonate transport system permease component